MVPLDIEYNPLLLYFNKSSLGAKKVINLVWFKIAPALDLANLLKNMVLRSGAENFG